MEMYPDRVFSKPEFTALPPYLFSGADFALIPSRDEPFGLVAVEFGRKGALGVGSRLGGLGLMPGWVSVYPSSSLDAILMHVVVVPCGIYLDGSYVVSTCEDDQVGFEIHRGRKSYTSCSVSCPAFPSGRMASAHGRYAPEEYQHEPEACCIECLARV